MDEKLVLKKEGVRWRHIESNHINYGLNNALKEVFEETKCRLFRFSDNGDEIYLVTPDKKKEKRKADGK